MSSESDGNCSAYSAGYDAVVVNSMEAMSPSYNYPLPDLAVVGLRSTLSLCL